MLALLAADDADGADGADSFLLLFVADLAWCPFHGLSLGDCNFLDASATFVQTSAVAIGMVAFGLWASTYINIGVLNSLCMQVAVHGLNRHTRKNYCQYDCCYCLHNYKRRGRGQGDKAQFYVQRRYASYK